MSVKKVDFLLFLFIQHDGGTYIWQFCQDTRDIDDSICSRLISFPHFFTDKSQTDFPTHESTALNWSKQRNFSPPRYKSPCKNINHIFIIFLLLRTPDVFYMASSPSRTPLARVLSFRFISFFSNCSQCYPSALSPSSTCSR